MNPVHQVRDLVRVGGTVDPVPQVENMGRGAGTLPQNVAHGLVELVARREESRRVQVPLHHGTGAELGYGPGEGEGPVDPHHVGSHLLHVGEEGGAAVGEVDDGPVHLGADLRDDPCHEREDEASVAVGTQEPHPGVEEHDRVGAGTGLGHQVADHGVAQEFQEPGGGLRLEAEEGAGLHEILGAPALHQVAEEGEGRSREPDEGPVRAQLRPNPADALQDEGRVLLRVQRPHGTRIGGGPDGLLQDRAGIEVQPHAHTLQRSHDVAEEDGGVQGEPLHGLERDPRRDLRRLGGGEEVHLLPELPVLGEVAPRLAHDPDGRVSPPLAAAGALEQRHPLRHPGSPFSS